MTRTTITDADGDIAALVYTSRDRPDLVLCAFAQHLVAAGKRLCGLVQLRDRYCNVASGRVIVLDSWQAVEVARKPAHAEASHCRLDAQWLDQMGTEAKASIQRGVDIVIVNRFGALEAAGRGFRDAILAASKTETPLIIAVPQFEFGRWTKFSSGMTVRLDCSLDSALRWWHGIQTSHGTVVPSAHACELLK